MTMYTVIQMCRTAIRTQSKGPVVGSRAVSAVSMVPPNVPPGRALRRFAQVTRPGAPGPGKGGGFLIPEGAASSDGSR
ncbi:hypothetical protein GCM10017776_14110 [Streptomyces griseoluteus]|nr:hypothetical protein GCM10017776_14110 [Streptomyces griseoluteus]